MPKVPISFLLAVPVLVAALFSFSQRGKAPQLHWTTIFLGAVFCQLILIGIRFGYGIEPIVKLHWIVSVLLPPLAYLMFSRAKIAWPDLLHLLPVIVVSFAVRIYVPAMIDVFLGCVGLIYLLALLPITRRTDWWFDWAPVRWANYLTVALWGTIAMQALATVTDFAIASDYFWGTGDRVGEIVGLACLGGFVIYVSAYFIWLKRGGRKRPSLSSDEDKVLLSKLSAELERDALFSNPELTLDRLSRRLAIPSRQISEAVNRARGQNFSQFV